MPIEQMNISLSPQMARFIRGKVKKGDYTNASEVVRDAVRRMQENEVARNGQAALAGIEESLSKAEQDSIRRSIERGLKDIHAGHYEEYDAEGLKGLAKDLVAASAKKHAAGSKRRTSIK